MESAANDQIKAMRSQLRRDYLYMQTKGLPPLYMTREEVNRVYQFSFPEGCFCLFVLGACSKIDGRGFTSAWMVAADSYIHERLGEFPGDFETLIQGRKLYCLMGSSRSRAEVTKWLHLLFDGLLNLQTTYSCAWTMGLGKFVDRISDLSESLSSAQHALKYSIRDGVERFYDGNTDCVIYEGALTLMTASEQLRLKRLVQKPSPAAIRDEIPALFRGKQEQIRKYPVFSHMLALQILEVTIQTLREIMPVDRKTYELSLQYENAVDDIMTQAALLQHTISGVQGLCERYRLFLKNGRSQPLWLTLTYIQEHYTEHITLDELANVSCRNPQYISAMFSKACGMSITQYITGLRVEEAKRLLRATGMPIGEIAARTGYQDAKYFSRVFQRLTGKSPRDYRNAAAPT